jgi:hypothetical protein
LHILGELFWQFFPQKRLDLNIYTVGAMVLYFGQQPRALLQHFLVRADLYVQPFLPENGCFRRLWGRNGLLRRFKGGTAQKRLDPNVHLWEQVVMWFVPQPPAPLHHRLARPFLARRANILIQPFLSRSSAEMCDNSILL